MDEYGSIESERIEGPIEMKEVYHLGKVINYIHVAAVKEENFCDTDDSENYILDALEDVTEILRHSNIDTAALSDIDRTKNDLIKSYIPDDEGTVGAIKLNEEDYEDLQNSARTWDSIINEELSSLEPIHIENTGLLDVKQAMDSPENLFHDSSIWEDLPKQTKSDLTEACQTLAFDCPTSTVFLSLRAVEERLHAWYMNETQRDIEDRTFGQVLSELDDYYHDDDRPPILSHLDFLKERRNQVAHPERSPGSQEAESTLIMVRETITNIQQQLVS